MARTPAPDTRDRILDAAGRLFDEHGVHAVGIQRIIDACGCGKNVLYREFASKDDLVVAYLERCQQRWLALLDEGLRPAAGDPAAQLVAVVRTAVRQIGDDDFFGCPFRRTHSLFPDPDHPVNRNAVNHITDLRRRLAALAREARADDPDALANRLLLIVDGVYTSGAMFGTDGAVTAAVDVARTLVAQATAGGPR